MIDTNCFVHMKRPAVFVFVCFTSFIIRGDRTRASSSECEIDQAGFTDWMTFITSNLIDEISPCPKDLSTTI